MLRLSAFWRIMIMGLSITVKVLSVIAILNVLTVKLYLVQGLMV